MIRHPSPSRPRLRLCLMALTCLALAACQLGQPAGPAPLPPVGKASVDVGRKLCESSGGRFEPGEKGAGFLCFHTPPDAGKVCHRASDCSTACLARSHSCAPISPLIGCQEVLEEDGSIVSQCIN